MIRNLISFDLINWCVNGVIDTTLFRYLLYPLYVCDFWTFALSVSKAKLVKSTYALFIVALSERTL